MTRPQNRPPDPLAEFRQDDAPAGIPTAAPEPEPTPEPVLEAITGDVEALDLLWHQDAAARIVKRWHDDRDTAAQMHGGGTCGCRYLASIALVEALGQPAEAQPVPEPQED